MIIPVRKKGDKKAIRNWTEATGALDENQAGFRLGRSTADATHIFVRIQEDVTVVRNLEEINIEKMEGREEKRWLYF